MPAASSVIVAPLVPPAVHTAGVVVVNVTASPDDAVAPTVTGDLRRGAVGERAERDRLRRAVVTVKLRATGGGRR